jgi:hypothetical protein
MTAVASRRTPSRAGSQSLEARLAAYALAGGAVLAAAEQSQADVIYSGPQSIVVGPNSSYGVNVNSTGPLADNTIDYTFEQSVEGDFHDFFGRFTAVTVHGHGPNGVAGFLRGKKRPTFDLQALRGGQLIPGPFDFRSGTQSLAYRSVYTDDGVLESYSSGPFAGGATRFVGLEFDIGGNTHYGWVRVSVVRGPNILDDLQLTIHDWAYQDTPGAAIVAGQGIPPLPEPGSLAMLALGAVGALALLRYRKAQATTTTEN